MSLNDPLSIALSTINNAEKVGKTECMIYPASNIIKTVLKIFQDQGYIGEIKETSTTRGSALKINLLGKINKCSVIKPRYSVKYGGLEKFEKRYLPAKNFGIIIVSTNKGIITDVQAKENKLGGRLLAYCF